MSFLKFINILTRITIISLIIILFGCRAVPLNYSDLSKKPSAKMKGDCIQVFLGYTDQPVCWINPKVKIDDTNILISARMSCLWERPHTIDIKLPDTKKIYQLYWVDKDGTLTRILVEDENK